MEHCGTEINWEIWQVFYDKSRQNYANLLNLEEHSRRFAKVTLIMFLVSSILHSSPGSLPSRMIQPYFPKQNWEMGPTWSKHTECHKKQPNHILYTNPWHRQHLKFARVSPLAGAGIDSVALPQDQGVALEDSESAPRASSSVDSVGFSGVEKQLPLMTLNDSNHVAKKLKDLLSRLVSWAHPAE